MLYEKEPLYYIMNTRNMVFQTAFVIKKFETIVAFEFGVNTAFILQMPGNTIFSFV